MEFFWGEDEGEAVGVEEEAVVGFEGAFPGLDFGFGTFADAAGEDVVVVAWDLGVFGGFGLYLFGHGVVLGEFEVVVFLEEEDAGVADVAAVESGALDFDGGEGGGDTEVGVDGVADGDDEVVDFIKGVLEIEVIFLGDGGECVDGGFAGELAHGEAA